MGDRKQNPEITVIKRNIHRQETFRYTGTILAQDAETLILEAFFNRPDLPFHGIVLEKGDRFVETYFTKRWYNIFAIYDRSDRRLKGWYCNITYPAEIYDGVVSYVDLALDLLVYPDGRQLVLDLDDYESLNLPPEERQQVEAALDELKAYFNKLFTEDGYLKI